MEHMLIPLREIKFAAAPEAGADAMSFSGYGAVFGNVDSYGDVIAPGAFADTLAKAQKTGTWPAMLSQHGGWAMSADDMTPVGVWTSLAEDGIGLKAEGVLAPTQRGRELHALMKMQPRPAIDGLSIGYIAKESTPRSSPEEPRRTLKKVDLLEISLVTFPANGRARVTGVKAIGGTEREIERWLMQDAGFSRREARIAINHGFKALIDSGTQDAAEGELAELAAAIRRSTAALA